MYASAPTGKLAGHTAAGAGSIGLTDAGHAQGGWENRLTAGWQGMKDGAALGLFGGLGGALFGAGKRLK